MTRLMFRFSQVIRPIPRGDHFRLLYPSVRAGDRGNRRHGVHSSRGVGREVPRDAGIFGGPFVEQFPKIGEF